MKNLIEERRVGTFEISYDLIKLNWRDVLLLMRDVIIVRAEMMVHKNSIEYIAYSPKFEICEEGIISPLYQPEVHQAGKKKIIKWGKLDASD